MTENQHNPFSGRYYAVICMESDNLCPRMMFRREADARTELDRRQALEHGHDDWLSDDYAVLPVDVAGIIWNSFDPDPRAEHPLSVGEIAVLHGAANDIDADATLFVYQFIDLLMRRGRFDLVDRLLTVFENCIDELSTVLMLAFLSVTDVAREHLRHRESFARRVRERLEREDPERVEDLLRGLE